MGGVLTVPLQESSLGAAVTFVLCSRARQGEEEEEEEEEQEKKGLEKVEEDETMNY
ncbi:hypothetical protein E2C01_096914 [Portunus trituberculatus]|uniref:Uncharacterized protein n=1 Tax=Portunus trituberculatus TaxID=210409 RepID=A0A5B7K8J8_PORTR|nr:hypothetical protein [Portunus trituberculatus]